MKGRYYGEWLLSKVLLEGWTTRRCADVLGLDPEDVEKTYEALLYSEFLDEFLNERSGAKG